MDKFEQIAATAQVCAAVLGNPETGDFALLPLTGEPLSHTDLLRAMLSRSLRLGGVVGLIDGCPRTALSEPIEDADMRGLVGNVGTGTGSAYAVDSAGLYLLQSTIDAVGTLKAQYYGNAAWLMSRATATAIRKAQIQANLFAPVWTRENGRDLLHGFPVSYSSSMPSLPTSTTSGVSPIMFGSFQDGYVIGDRGGTGTFVKILDQPLATSGQTVLLGYKRVDGRVRRSEAIQQISVSHT